MGLPSHEWTMRDLQGLASLARLLATIKERPPSHWLSTTGQRLVTLHNLAFVARVMADLRAAILAGTLSEVAAALRGGAAPSGKHAGAGVPGTIR